MEEGFARKTPPACLSASVAQAQAQAQGRVRDRREAVWRNRPPENGTRLAQKKVRDQPAVTWLKWIDPAGPVALTRQCELAGVVRSTVYSHQQVRQMPVEDVALSHLLDEFYTAHPFFGPRRTVKYEDVYLRGYATLGELTVGLADYFQFYNAERMHQSLGNLTLDEVYRTGQGGGASVPDHFAARKEIPETEKTGQRCAAATMAEALT